MLEPLGIAPEEFANRSPTLDITGSGEPPPPCPDPTNPYMPRNPAHTPGLDEADARRPKPERR